MHSLQRAEESATRQANMSKAAARSVSTVLQWNPVCWSLFPIHLQVVSLLLPCFVSSASAKTISKIKGLVQEGKIFNTSDVSRAEISTATNSRQIQVSKCSRYGSRRHLQFQEADLYVSTTSVQSTSSLEYRWKLQVNTNCSSSQWIEEYWDEWLWWWAEYYCMCAACVDIYIYKHTQLISTLTYR